MDSPSASSQVVPSQFASIFLDVLRELLGEHGTRTVLRRAGLADWIEAPPPPSLTHWILAQPLSILMTSLEDIYGSRGGRALGRRMGSAWMERCLKDVGALAGMPDQAFQHLPSRARLRLGLGALRRVLSQLRTMEADILADDERLVFSVAGCPFCQGRSLETAGCTPLVGLVEAAIRAAAPDVHLIPEETGCRATGHAACEVTVVLPQEPS